MNLIDEFEKIKNSKIEQDNLLNRLNEELLEKNKLIEDMNKTINEKDGQIKLLYKYIMLEKKILMKNLKK